MPIAPWLTYMVLDSAFFFFFFFFFFLGGGGGGGGGVGGGGEGGIYPIKISHVIHYNFNFIG